MVALLKMFRSCFESNNKINTLIGLKLVGFHINKSLLFQYKHNSIYQINNASNFYILYYLNYNNDKSKY